MHDEHNELREVVRAYLDAHDAMPLPGTNLQLKGAARERRKERCQREMRAALEKMRALTK